MGNPDKLIEQDFSRRSQKYGEHVRSYKDPKLYALMKQGLGFNTEEDFKRKTKNWRVLDLAAGTGLASEPFRQSGAEVFYLDLVPKMIREGIKQGNIPPGRAFIGRAEEVSSFFPENFFDLVLIRFALHDIKDQEKLFSEVYKILRPKGKFQIIDMAVPKGYSKKCEIFYNYLHLWKTYGQPRECYIRSIEDLETLSEKASFKVFSKRWYRSIVITEQWLKEGQITPTRLMFLNDLIKAHMLFYEIKKLFRIQFVGDKVRVSFPVIVLTLIKDS